jgi:hypothetical protein
MPTDWRSRPMKWTITQADDPGSGESIVTVGISQFGGITDELSQALGMDHGGWRESLRGRTGRHLAYGGCWMTAITRRHAGGRTGRAD